MLVSRVLSKDNLLIARWARSREMSVGFYLNWVLKLRIMQCSVGAGFQIKPAQN